MANIKSAKKMVRKIATRTARNKNMRSAMRSLIRGFKEGLAKQDKKASQRQFALVEQALAKAAQKGIIHKRHASRKISNFARKLSKLSQLKK